MGQRVFLVLILSILVQNCEANLCCDHHYYQDYCVDSFVERILDMHAKEIYKKVKSVHYGSRKHGVWKFDWLPGYYVKYDVSRIKGMKRVKKCINRYGLNLLGVADKRIYHIYGRSRELSSLNYVVVVPEIVKAANPQPVTLAHAKQLAILVENSNYVDLNSSNYIQTDDGKLIIIDTELIFDRDRHLDAYVKLIASRRNLNTHYTPDALKFIFHQLADHLTYNSSGSHFSFSKIDKAFGRQKQPYAWDYIGYCENLISPYRTGRKREKHRH